MSTRRGLIQREFEKRGELKASDLVERLHISRQAVHRHLAAMVRSGELIRQGGGKRDASYLLNTAAARRNILGRKRGMCKRVLAAGLAEDRLLSEVEARTDSTSLLSPQALAIFRFAFTEMVNNAVDHSGARRIEVSVSMDRATASFRVADAGVGVFENIRGKKGLADEMEAIQDLLKGKTTTAPEAHSGEGIFFTSKAVDRFVLESHRKRLTVDNVRDDVFVEDRRFRKGTRVEVEISAQTRRTLSAIFHSYTGEDFQFDRSRIAVKLFASGDAYVSRSQAKRLLHSMASFRRIELDFTGVPTVGQAFADEVFRVFKKAHPDIEITAIHANENVDFMIRRAMAPA